MNAEQQRLEEARLGSLPWRRWGAYLSERQWGTVREDYSADGDAWTYLSHDAARSRAYRWGEDGLAGFSDQMQYLCCGLALWNTRDPILKERLFGLTNHEGNHGEDVKEQYFYLDATPTHSYLKMLYKYPQAEFPYARLVDENRRRDRMQPEFELFDTGVFEGDRYFDVFVEYAKAGPEDVLIQVTICNRGPDDAPLCVLPQVWFRNTWSWSPHKHRPQLALTADGTLLATHAALGSYQITAQPGAEWLFTENETNYRRLWGLADSPPHAKDAFHEYVVNGNKAAVNPEHVGTKAAALHRMVVPGRGQVTLRWRMSHVASLCEDVSLSKSSSTKASTTLLSTDFDVALNLRRKEADAFYGELQQKFESDDARNVQRQALAGMIWSQQFYHYNVAAWLDGDPAQPKPPRSRRDGRNADWRHLNSAEVLSMPDKWEYPWFAAWDLGFHCLALAMIDPEFAKNQLTVLAREWYQHPNGALPAYEWEFGDSNPPVHAWATWRVFQMDRRQCGGAGDLAFLERVFHKLLLNFTWWVNRKDADNRNVFQGGFLGLDNIGVFDRSTPLPDGGRLDQADGTSWMAMYSLTMLRIALELAQHNPVYQDIASKFFEHFLSIAAAMTCVGGGDGVDGKAECGIALWDNDDEFFYDVIHFPDGRAMPLKLH
ncbi:MAG: glucosidase, partial [Planctomycetia bacterium]|nr:glucosidase [Planctomycetia bacterium]